MMDNLFKLSQHLTPALESTISSPCSQEKLDNSCAFFILQTSASLKFTVLNPKGRIWTMVAGGGASVIYADTVSSHLSHLLTRSLLLPQPHLVWLVAYSVLDVNLLVLQFRDCHGNLPAYLNKLASFCTAKKKKIPSFFSCYHLT